MRLRQHSKGFTLIELVIVIVILGILAAIAVPKFLDVKTEAENAAKKANETAVVSALAIYLAKNNGTYPTLTQLDGVVDGNAGIASGNSGLTFTLPSGTQTVETYKDDSCATATSATSDQVKCIKRTA